MLGRHGLTGRIAQQKSAAFSKSSRSMSSFRPQISRLPVRPGKTLSGTATWRTSVPSISGAATIRFNSTAAATTGGAVPAASASSDSGFNVSELDLSNVDISRIPEKIGYLKELGLDYGWGPSSVVQFTMEHFHIWGGLPWLGSIVATGALVRFALLPLFFRAADHGTKTANTRHLTQPIRTEMIRASQEQNQAEILRCKAELQKINKEHGISAMAMFMPMFLQIPLGYGCYRVISGMAHLPVPALTTEQFGWITDFTVADPYFILPLMTALLQYMTIRRGGEFGNTDPNMKGLQKMVQFGMPAIAFAFTAWWPAALQLYFASTATFGFMQSLAINNVAFRKLTGMAIPNKYIPPPPPGTEASEQSRHLRTLAEAAAHLEAEAKSRSGELQQVSHQTQMSFIDRALKSAKEGKDRIVRETTQKVNEMSGKGPKLNADGTPAQPDRLSDKDRKLAEDYEKRRKEEDEWRREEQNHARREAHLQAMERQREQARTAWKRTNTKAKQR
ncbi:60Kd inner membrane protein-domain-containing protein [Aspergillus granulosus]|uniref:60Kd inner membrane protein-domain-containing protein n=1 Tax=Aspergillus granulosus TaxID=176169 RepID=A0ABR4GVR4_9EURO